MPGTSLENINLVDDGNSFNGLLGSAGTFVGTFTDITGYTSLTVFLSGTEIFDLAKFEWSDDGITVRDSKSFFDDLNTISYGGGISASTTVRAKFYRINILNGVTPQTTVVQVLLRRGPSSGYVSPIAFFPLDGDDGLTVKSVMFGRRVSGTPVYTPVLTDGNGRISVVRPPNPTSSIRLTVPASLTSVNLDTGVFGFNRKKFILFNDTDSGILHIRLGGPAALNDYDFKVPPQHTWKLDDDWYIWGGSIEGIWDVADGIAYTSEII